MRRVSGYAFLSIPHSGQIQSVCYHSHCEHSGGSVQLRDEFVAVKVPATAANLGPGFDAFGLALDLWDEISVHATTGATTVVVEGENAETIDDAEKNPIVRSLRLALDYVGAPQVGLRVHCTQRIPRDRGLGASAAEVVAGLTLARALVGVTEVLPADDILQIATDLEGHPDNVAAALLGGATVAWMDDGTAGAVRISPATGIAPVVFIPSFEVSTARARALLPDAVSHSAATFNAGRAALLGALLSGAEYRAIGGTVGDEETERENGAPSLHDLLLNATGDRLHQDYRRSLMESSYALVEWLREAGFPAVISGVGPTVLSMENVPADIREQARGAGWKVLPLSVAQGGTQITRGRLSAEDL